MRNTTVLFNWFKAVFLSIFSIFTKNNSQSHSAQIQTAE